MQRCARLDGLSICSVVASSSQHFGMTGGQIKISIIHGNNLELFLADLAASAIEVDEVRSIIHILLGLCGDF